MATPHSDLDHAVDQKLAAAPPPTASAGTSTTAAASPTAAAAAAPASPALDLGVSEGWWSGMKSSVTNLVNPPPSDKPQSTPQKAVATARAVQGVVGAALGSIGAVGDMINAGFANLTSPIAAVFPSLPAASITMMYLGVPHTHNHPPSLIPPAPPVPLPSIGAIMLGTSVRVLINGMPAARCGDIGLAPTCVGIVPFFQLKTGSSNTFIGGNRAARMLDVCQVCAKGDPPEKKKPIEAGKAMGAVGAAARGVQGAQAAMGYAAIALDASEAATDPDPAMAAAKAMAAAMAAAQMAADKAAEALSKTMGTDPAGLPPKAVGAVTLGHPNVLIGGFPMVNIPNPADLLLKKLARYKTKPSPKKAATKSGCTA